MDRPSEPPVEIFQENAGRKQPHMRQGWDKFLNTCYNKDRGECLGRTPRRWAQIFGYLVCFYVMVVGYWFALFYIFKQTLSYEKPTYTLDASLIGHYSGLSSLPRHAFGLKNNVYIFREGYDGSELDDTDLMETTTKGYLARYEKFMKDTKLMKLDNSTKFCTEEELHHSRLESEGCHFNLESLGDCSKFPYGYSEGMGKSEFQPCILIKLNRVFDFVPVPFRDKDLHSIPKGFPKQLEKYVSENKDLIFIDCKPGNSLAKEQMDENTLQYFPENQGIPLGYFPYKSHYYKFSPLVAVKLRKFPAGLMLPIKCRLWHKNMEHPESEADQTLIINILVDLKGS